MVLRVLAQLEALSAEGKLCVILASNSLQRREILRKNLFGPKIVVEVLPSNFKEDFNKVDYVGKANRYVTEYADQKAQDVIKQLCERHSTESYQLDQLIVVIAADTVVELDGNILEKPGSEGQAVQMLLSLSDRTHKVVSGVHIALLRLIEGALTTVHCTSFHEESIVTFDFVSAERAQAYVATGEPLNKAGSYAIQGLGGQLIRRLDGCYYNVMGLPLNRTASELCKMLDLQDMLRKNS